MYWIFCRSLYWLRAFSGSTSNIASVSSSLKMLNVTCTAALHPPGRPAQSCRLPALSIITGFTIAFPTIHLTISPTPIGLTPGFFSIGINRQAMHAFRDELLSGWTTISLLHRVLAKSTIAVQSCFPALPKLFEARICCQLSASIPECPHDPLLSAD